MNEKRVLSVGQCGADHGSISRTLHSRFGAKVTSADSVDDALNHLREGDFSLVLVNRVFDADGSRGIELIRKIHEDKALSHVPVMLVSNHDDAQAEAEKLGAVPGFGKAALGHPAMLARIGKYLT